MLNSTIKLESYQLSVSFGSRSSRVSLWAKRTRTIEAMPNILRSDEKPFSLVLFWAILLELAWFPYSSSWCISVKPYLPECNLQPVPVSKIATTQKPAKLCFYWAAVAQDSHGHSAFSPAVRGSLDFMSGCSSSLLFSSPPARPPLPPTPTTTMTTLLL